MSQSDTIVVTGAGSGIGRALAMGFSGDGYNVVGLGRTAAALEATAAACAAGRFTYRVVDVADAAAVDAALASIGPIQALICNAALYPRVYFLDQSADDWDHALRVNVSGVANCCRSALPRMLETNTGRIVIVGSLADINPIPASSAYSVSKAGLHTLTRALASEIDRERFPNVLVNEFNPGATRTAMSADGDDPASLYPHVKRLVDFPAGGPTGRMFRRDQEIRLNEGLRAKVVRRLLRLLGRN